MNTPKTQKEILLLLSAKLDDLSEDNDKLARNHLQLASDFSTYINKSDLQMAKILGYLESDSKTNTKGVIEQVKINTYDINNIKIEKKVDKAKIGVIGVIIGAILSFIAKVFF